MHRYDKVSTCLWFDDDAEEAVNFYIPLFANSRILDVTRYGRNQPGREDRVLTVSFTLDGRDFMALNGGPHFKQTEASSMFVRCRDQAEIDRLWTTLSEGGETRQCGWLRDRYGLFWQIVPEALDRIMSDPRRAERAVAKVMTMEKIDLAALEAA